jgi:hypothetical protein
VLREKAGSTIHLLSLELQILYVVACLPQTLQEQVKDDFLELFPDMIVYDPAEDLFEDQDKEDD